MDIKGSVPIWVVLSLAVGSGSPGQLTASRDCACLCGVLSTFHVCFVTSLNPKQSSRRDSLKPLSQRRNLGRFEDQSVVPASSWRGGKSQFVHLGFFHLSPFQGRKGTTSQRLVCALHLEIACKARGQPSTDRVPALGPDPSALESLAVA